MADFLENAEQHWHSLRAGRQVAFIGLIALGLTACLIEALS